MALTPEDVVNKRFNPTKFREGYDQDEVDDFLDEVVVELRRLNAENEELRQRLMAADGRMQEMQRALQQAPQAMAAAPAPSPAAAPPQQYQAPSEVDPSLDPSNTNNLLQLARRLHEEHVREGMEKRDALIAEGHAAAAKIVSDAQDNQRAAIAGLEQEKVQVEQRIEELRNFEREYRMRLKQYIEGQLHELDARAPSNLEPAAAIATAGHGYDAPTQVYDYRGQEQAYDYGQQPPVNYGQPQQPTDYSGYQQPTEYPGFAGGN